MYVIKTFNNSHAIFFKDRDGKEELVLSNLSLKEAWMWCDRLQYSYDRGFAYKG